VRKALSAVCGAMCLAGLLWAQDAPKQPSAQPADRGKQYLEQRVATLAEKLGLSDEQKAKVKEIYEKQAKDIQALRSDTTLSEDARRTKMREIAKATNDAIVALLTPEQKAKWEAYLKERRDSGNRPAGDNPARTSPEATK